MNEATKAAGIAAHTALDNLLADSGEQEIPTCIVIGLAAANGMLRVRTVSPPKFKVDAAAVLLAMHKQTVRQGTVTCNVISVEAGKAVTETVQ